MKLLIARIENVKKGQTWIANKKTIQKGVLTCVAKGEKAGRSLTWKPSRVTNRGTNELRVQLNVVKMFKASLVILAFETRIFPNI